MFIIIISWISYAMLCETDRKLIFDVYGIQGNFTFEPYSTVTYKLIISYTDTLKEILVSEGGFLVKFRFSLNLLIFH